MAYYCMVIGAALLLALDFSFSKTYQAWEGITILAGLKFNTLNGLVTAAIFFTLSGFKMEFSAYSALLAFCMSLFAMIYSVVGFRVLKDGNMSIYSIFLMSGGMLLPYLFGVMFLNEDLTLSRTIGLTIILVAAVLSNGIKGKLKTSFLLLCAAVFVLNGAVSILSKCHQINTANHAVSSTMLITYTGIAKFVIGCTVFPFCRRNVEPLPFSSKRTVYVVICSALVGGVSYMLQLTGARELPASVLYPIVSGGSIIFSALSGKLLFKEKLSVYQLVSIGLCFVGTLLFL